jgi:hypothetical protein
MRRLRALVLAFGLLGLAASSAVAKPTLIYLSAEDCPTCRAWERAHQPAFEKSAERQKVEWRVVSVKTVYNINQRSEWPSDLEWLRTQVPKSGTPRFYLIEGGRLIAKGDGASGWTGVILPELEKLGG